MKKILYSLVFVLLAVSSSCDKEGKILTPRLIVECTPEVNGPDNVQDCRVELHTTPQLNSPVVTAQSEGTTDFATATFELLNPNTYYCTIWKDNNTNDTLDAGDFYGSWPQEISISDSTDLTITVVVRTLQP